MSIFLASPISYLIPSLYLTFLTVFAKRYSPPAIIHLAIASIGLMVNILSNGLWSGVRALGVASLMFVLLVLLGVLSRTGTFAIPVALVSLPVIAWVAFLPGILLAFIVSLVRIARATNKSYLASIAVDTYTAIGAVNLLNNLPPRLNLDILPIPSASKDDLSIENKVSKIKINFNVYLAVSLIFIGLLAILKN